MDPLSAIALFGPMIANLIPQVAKLFDRKAETPEKLAAAQAVVDTIVKSTGTADAKQAVGKLLSDEAALKSATEAVLVQPNVSALLEIGGGVVAAREADIKQQSQDRPFWKTSAVFWVSMSLLPLVYWFVGSVIVGNDGLEGAWQLFGSKWDGESRAGIANLVLGLVLGGICGVYFGISVTQGKQQQIANQEK